MKIEVLGDGCSRCNQLYENVLMAVKEREKKVEVVKELDPQKIANYNVRSLPGLVIDGVLKISGKVSNVEEINDWIK